MLKALGKLGIYFGTSKIRDWGRRLDLVPSCEGMMYRLCLCILGVLFISSCDSRKSNVSFVDERLSVRSALEEFALLAGNMGESERFKLSSIEQLYFFANGNDIDAAKIDESGSTWSYLDRVSGSKYSYMVYCYKGEIALEDAVFIATPRAVQINGSRKERIVLTHGLRVIEIGEDEYHRRILRQLKVP